MGFLSMRECGEALLEKIFSMIKYHYVILAGIFYDTGIDLHCLLNVTHYHILQIKTCINHLYFLWLSNRPQVLLTSEQSFFYFSYSFQQILTLRVLYVRGSDRYYGYKGDSQKGHAFCPWVSNLVGREQTQCSEVHPGEMTYTRSRYNDPEGPLSSHHMFSRPQPLLLSPFLRAGEVPAPCGFKPSPAALSPPPFASPWLWCSSCSFLTFRVFLFFSSFLFLRIDGPTLKENYPFIATLINISTTHLFTQYAFAETPLCARYLIGTGYLGIDKTEMGFFL